VSGLPSWTITIGSPSSSGLRQPLLDRVAHHDEQDEIEGGQPGQLAPADHTSQHEDEREQNDGSERDIHQGK
jgi:hypothetical protein